MKSLLCLLLVGVVAILAAPSAPAFPAAFNTTFDFRAFENHTNNVGRWDYSLADKAEKFIHGFNHAEIEILRRYDQQKQYIVEKRPGAHPTCYEAALTGDLDYPSFKDYTYSGVFHHRGESVDMWEEKKASETFHYFDYTTTEIPFEFRTATTSMVFDHFQKGDQPASAFETPKDCKTFDATLTELSIQSRNLGHCATHIKVECAAILAICGVSCCAGGCAIDPACISCLGSLYEKCKSCF